MGEGLVSAAPWIAVIDDGELEDVRDLLDELGTSFTHWKKGAVPSIDREPRRLLVTTAALAVTLRFRRPPSSERGRAVWIAFIDGDSRTQRRHLLQSGFDFLVRRPAHAGALRLLLQSSLWTGDNKRRGARLAVGYTVSYRSGLMPRKATLVDLSAGGCRLLTTQRVAEGARLTVQLPGELCGEKAFGLRAKVLRAQDAELSGGDVAEVSLACRFETPGADIRAKLKKLLDVLAEGPPSQPERAPASRAYPDRQPRAAYDGEVVLFGSGELVLVGRDLSRGGMLVEPHPALHMNDVVQLALAGAARSEPVRVNARVVRDDGARGMALRFEQIERGGEARIDALVAELPAIESLAQDGVGVVLSQLLPKLLRLPKLPRS
jgi:c-di-GMP-binding flagellar brake protein YcgR